MWDLAKEYKTNFTETEGCQRFKEKLTNLSRTEKNLKMALEIS